MAGIYQPHKDASERRLHTTMELDECKWDKKRQRKRQADREREREKERVARDEESGTSSGVKWHRLRRDASTYASRCIFPFCCLVFSLSYTVCLFIARNSRHVLKTEHGRCISNAPLSLS